MNKPLFETSKLVFSASEQLREALDTIDLESLPVDAMTTALLDDIRGRLEGIAQRLKRDALQN